jgi:hypothetical protein
MKFATCLTILAGCVVLAGAADARQVYVPGFYRPNGVWVAPHYRTVPDGPVYQGEAYPNANPYNAYPYTGQVVPHSYPYGAYPYQAPYQAPYQSPYTTPYVPPPAAAAPVPYYGAP